MFILCEQLVRYNANDRNKDVGDCVKRTLSLAYNMPYSEVGKQLRKAQKELRQKAWNTLPCIRSFFQSHGTDTTPMDLDYDGGMTEAKFAREHPEGIYVLHSVENRGHHLVCVIDGDIYDSWDSSLCRVLHAWCISEETAGINHDFSVEQYFDFIQSATKEEWEKLVMKKYNIPIENISVRKQDSTTAIVTLEFNVLNEFSHYGGDKRIHIFTKFSYRDENIEESLRNGIVKEIKKVVSIFRKMKKNESEEGAYAEIFSDLPEFRQDSETKRLLNKYVPMKYWKAVISIERYQDYYDRFVSYDIHMFKLKSDPRYYDDSETTIYTRADGVKEIASAIAEYVDHGRRAGWDY